MRFIYFPIYTSALLFFGLTGCQPDKRQNNPDSPAPLRIINSNISLNQLNKVKTIDIKNSISLDFEKLKTQDNYFHVRSICWNDYLDNFSNTAIVDNRKPLAVKDILPIQAFTPFSNSQPKLFCDFEINFINDNEQEVNNSKLFLKEIEITNIENYSNFELPLGIEKNPGKTFYLKKNGIQSIKFTLPIDNGEVFTLCEKTGKVHPFEKQVLEMGLFFDEKLFESNNLLFCRLVIHQQIPEKNWITKAFFIQGQEPKITYQYRHNYTGNTENQWNHQKMGVLTLSNESAKEVYLQISEFSTIISVMGVYSNFSKKNINHKSNQVNLNVFWTVDNGIPIKEGDEKSPHIYKLEAGKSMDLSLKTHESLLCNYGEPLITSVQKNQPVSMGIENDFGSKFDGIQQNSFETFMEIETRDCKTLFYLSGLLYHLHRFPKITFNLFQTMDYQKWQPLPLEGILKLQYNEKFSQWVPNYQVSHHCSGIEIKNELTNYPIKNDALSNLFKCRLNMNSN